MKFTTITAATLGLISSTSAAAGDYFGVIASRSGSPIHLQAWAANGEEIWIGKKTASYCPQPPVENCPKGRYTNFGGGNGDLSMGTVVPGGQLVYIDPSDGTVGYTQAHSARMPDGAILDGWHRKEFENLGSLRRKQALLACPVNGKKDEGPWKVHVELKHLSFGPNCIPFDAVTSNQTKPDAYEYT